MLLFIRDNVVIAKVDADAHRSLGEKFDVKGFPTLKWFPAGSTEPQDYDGPRDAPGIVKYIMARQVSWAVLSCDRSLSDLLVVGLVIA